MRKNLLISILLVLIGCSDNEALIRKENAVSIDIITNDKEINSKKLTDSDSITTILSKLNTADEKVVKFYATHKLIITYSTGEHVSILCNGFLIKFNGRTYKLNNNISSLLK
jgi:uncharacterized protein YcfL